MYLICHCLRLLHSSCRIRYGNLTKRNLGLMIPLCMLTIPSITSFSVTNVAFPRVSPSTNHTGMVTSRLTFQPGYRGQSVDNETLRICLSSQIHLEPGDILSRAMRRLRSHTMRLGTFSYQRPPLRLRVDITARRSSSARCGMGKAMNLPPDLGFG